MEKPATEELFFEVVYADPTMSDADKARWLYESAKEYWRKLQYCLARYAVRDADATRYEEQAASYALDLRRVRDENSRLKAILDDERD